MIAHKDCSYTLLLYIINVEKLKVKSEKFTKKLTFGTKEVKKLSFGIEQVVHFVRGGLLRQGRRCAGCYHGVANRTGLPNL